MMRARPAAHSHADLIGTLIRRHGAEQPITEVVKNSWSRCLNNYALDPQEIRRPNSVERADLQARRERLGVLLSIARIEMEALGKLIRHSEYSIMLTDRDGVIWRPSTSREPPTIRRATRWRWSSWRRRTSRTARSSAPAGTFTRCVSIAVPSS